jgi:hypothetical protein
MPGRNEARRQSTGTPAVPDWGEIFLALSQQEDPPRGTHEPEGLSEAQLLALLDGAEGCAEARALLLRLVAMKFAAARG